MKSNTANTSPAGRTVRETFGPALLLAAAPTVLLLQGCTTARPAWSCEPEANPSPWSAAEHPMPHSGIALLNVKF